MAFDSELQVVLEATVFQCRAKTGRLVAKSDGLRSALVSSLRSPIPNGKSVASSHLELSVGRIKGERMHSF